MSLYSKPNDWGPPEFWLNLMREFAIVLPTRLHQCSTWDGFLYTAGKTLVDSKDWFVLKFLPLPCPWLEVILWPNILATGSLPWFRCACSACAEKPEEITRCPLWTLGSKTWQHGIMVGVPSLSALYTLILAPAPIHPWRKTSNLDLVSLLTLIL